MLTDLTCRIAKPKEKAYKIRDGKGLYLFISPVGGKSWRYDYKIKRPDDSYKNGTFVFGAYPAISLADARKNHLEVKKLIAQGIDPNVDKKDQKRLEQQSKAITFKDIAYEWLEKRRGEIKEKTLKSIQKRIEQDVLPEIGQIPISQLNCRSSDLI